ncbi:NAD-dependent epimerase/dehydratase family protein [Acuticoccus mangrovi]|uniref:NAD(P)-dependent oxidoreductase n=1 Tax=Acuticoccus mangrovi TaxID=2796142 RepID=A0A934MD39_9HYPH|nr:NAD(P)-dependent oxidoreductase [Acuticoccus mangrovi]MBJ3775932.1 NAD(P)-dependent oxidoreductase [Acuticoccus mangrovi]
MRTIIFGGAGFVGLNIAEALLRRGDDVMLVDRTPVPATARAWLGRLDGRLTMRVGDVTDPLDVAGAMAHGADAVVYGAAITAGPKREAVEPEGIFAVNVSGFVRVLEAARGRGVRRVVNLSSSAAYGAAAFRSSDPLQESTTIPDPNNLYGISKFGSERIADRLRHLWGMDFVNVRLSAVFGRWERATAVRDTPSPPHQVLNAALAGRPALIPRRDRRDYVYAPDAAKAVVTLCDAPRLPSALYNVSSGASWSLVDFAAALAERIPFEYRLCNEGETPTIDLHMEADRAPMSIERLAAETGFRPEFGLHEAVDDLVGWLDGPGRTYLRTTGEALSSR